METRTGRGDYRSYLVSVIVLWACIVGLVLLYRLLDPLLMEMWDGRSAPYSDEYRTWGAKVWRLLHRSTSSWVVLWIPLLWMVATFLIQFGLKQGPAKAFNKVHVVGLVVLSILAVLSLVGLMLMPLGVWSTSP